MRTYIDIIPRPVVVTQPAALLNRLLFCDTCGDWTAHALTASGEYYVCGCGVFVIYIVNNAPHLWAIR